MKNIIKINKKIVLVFVITLLISIISYINYLPEYYSIDTTKILSRGYLGYATKYSIQDGRVFSFLIFYIAEILDISMENLWRILLISAITVSSICVIKLYNIITKLKPATTKNIKIALYLIVYCYIFNFMYIDCLEFAECLIMASSIWFYILSAESIVLKKKNLKGILYCIIGIFFYQGTLNVFIATSILFLLIDEKISNKELIKKLVIIGIATIISVALNFVVMHIAKTYAEIKQATRLKWDLIENLKRIQVYLPKLIVNSLKLFPKYVQLALIGIILVLILISNIKEKKPFKILLPIGLILVCYSTSMAQTILTPSLLTSINGRVFISTGMLISALLIYAYVKTEVFENKYLSIIINLLIVLYFVINMVNTIHKTGMLKTGNDIDRELSYEIQEAIEQYEEETKNEIKFIAIRYRNTIECDKKWLRSKKMMRIYTSNVYRIYTGEILIDTRFEADIKEKYFKTEEPSIKCIDNIVYVYV